MKFLITARMKDMFYMLPLDKQGQVQAGAAAFIEKHRKAGACTEIYALPCEKGAVSIWDIDSAEKGAALFIENPSTPYQDVEMRVLADFDTTMKVQQHMYKQLSARK